VDLLTAFAVATGLIFVAELGDKSQLLSLWFATRYRVWTVLAGVATATLLLQGIAVVVGAVFGAVIPQRTFLTIAAFAFFAFAAWSLRREDDEEEEEVRSFPVLGAFGIVTVSLVVSEMGDKTQLATITLAGSRDPLGVWLGASLGMFAANAIAVAIGKIAGKRLPQRAISIGAAILFALFGAVTLWEAWR
jgi:Ca2+/H+ antiporter, TMEM165/GDT1 family